jgi:hypothetical protein
MEIAYFDRGPLNADELVFGGYWSTYWYGGKIYGTETMRGLDVLDLAPSEYLTENEIAAAKLANQGKRFNPQQQFPVTWPAEPVVARAYMDQLERGRALPESTLSALVTALEAAETTLADGARDRQLASRLRALAEDLDGNESDPLTAKRLNGLAATLGGMAARLR